MAIEILKPESPEEKFDLEDWKESLADQRPSGDIAISLRQTQDAIAIHIPARKILSATKFILGYAIADNAAPWLLRRPRTPLQHPFMPWLHADSVSIRLEYPQGSNDFKKTWNGAEYPTARRATNFTVGYGLNYTPEYYAKYAYASMLVRFTQHYAQYFDDGDPDWNNTSVGKEWIRSTSFGSMTPKAEAVALEGATDNSSLYWAETAADDPGSPEAGPFSNPIRSPVFVPKNTSSYQIVWRCVPENYICKMNYDNPANLMMPYPERFMKQLGTVNSETFPSDSGHEPGTLLFEDVKFDRYRLPVLTNGEYGLYAYDIYMTFNQFSPKRSSNANWQPVLGLDPTPERKNGHQLYPYRSSVKGYWFAATRGIKSSADPYVPGVADNIQGTYGGGTIPDSTDFYDLFRHVSNPLYPMPW